MVREIDTIEAGDVITARSLNEYGEGINKLNRTVFDAPRQRNKGLDPGLSDSIQDDSDPQELDLFIESSRTTTTVQVFDQNEENYAEIERIETVTFINGHGETLKLKFDNPL